jgi:hypothetical protein
VPSESDLRDLLQGADPEGRAAIDLDAVLTRARRRRRPKVVAAQALGSVALVGVLVTAIGVSLPRGGESAASIAQDAAGGTAEAGAQPFADEDALKIADCGTEPNLPPAEGWDLVVTSSALGAPGEAAVGVTLGVDAPRPELGTVTVTDLTIVRDGVIVAHATPAGVSARIDLGAGQTVSLEAVAPVVACDPAESLPAATYLVTVDLDYLADGSTGAPQTIRSALTEIVLD